jgi:hypothetical protein
MLALAVGKADIRVGAVFEPDADGVLGHVVAGDDPFSSGGLDRSAPRRSLLAEGDVLFLLVLEAAHKAPAQPRYLHRVERKVLLLGHADGDGILIPRE